MSNTNFGPHDINNQCQRLMQFTSGNTSIPITVSNNQQLVHQIFSPQSSFLNAMASQVPIKQEIFDSCNEQSASQLINTQSSLPNLITRQVLIKQEVFDSNNNDGSNIPVPIKVIGLKPGENLSMNNIQGLLPGAQGSIFLKTNNDFQLVKIGSTLNSGDTNFRPMPIAPKVTTSSTTVAPIAISYHLTSSSGTLNLNQRPVVSSQTSVTSRITASVPSVIVNTTAPSTMKTVSANSVVSTSPAASTQSDKEKIGLPKLHKFFHYFFVDKKIGAEDFCSNLVVILNAESQPGLVNFLNLNILFLRRALYLGELTLEGIRAPPVNVFSSLHPKTATNNQSFIRKSGGRSILVPVNGSQSQKILKSSVTVPALRPSSTVNVPVVNKTMSAATRMVSLTVMAGTTQVRNSQTLLTPAKAQIQAVNSLDKLKPVFTPVSGKRIIQKSPAVTSLKTSQNLSTVVSNVHGLSLPKISNMTVPLLSSISNASGPSLPIMSYGNIKKLPVSTSSTVQRPLNHGIKIDNVQPVNKKNLTISPLAKDDKKEVSPETNVAKLTDIMELGVVDIEKESEISSHEKIGEEIRSCEDKLFLISSVLKEKINKILHKHEIEAYNKDVLALVSHATEQRLKDLVEKMGVVAEHRVDLNRTDPQYEPTQDVRAQLRFLEEVDKAQSDKREAEERQAILKASKSRSKNEELAKLKEQAKAIQKAEMEERLTRDTNLAALQALGPMRKKPRLEDNTVSALTRRVMRPRIKRVCTKDLIFVLQQEKYSCRSQFLYKAYLKSIKK
ncbi:transcription initiation factor TFIID subunit 4-like [Cotesia glomerata]|uniref:transcription initiation factor TFIID subunit 4-like n=1 Tax=Cotesia glomerata TaxID=32391 RepID=UPI001D005B91|nr:transcription initiation factor TFIID subunit 4-like [Cotesia glomerata]